MKQKFENIGVILSRNAQKKIGGGLEEDQGGCLLVTIDATCTCPATSCKCQSGVGLSPGSKPSCISIWSDGSCNFASSTECHGEPESLN